MFDGERVVFLSGGWPKYTSSSSFSRNISGLISTISAVSRGDRHWFVVVGVFRLRGLFGKWRSSLCWVGWRMILVWWPYGVVWWCGLAVLVVLLLLLLMLLEESETWWCCCCCWWLCVCVMLMGWWCRWWGWWWWGLFAFVVVVCTADATTPIRAAMDLTVPAATAASNASDIVLASWGCSALNREESVNELGKIMFFFLKSLLFIYFLPI